MTLELGKYALEVLLAYALSLGCLVVLIFQSVAQSRRIRARLREEEEIRNRNA